MLDFDSFVLTAATDTLADEPAARGVADAVEFRMDFASDPLEAIAAYDGELPLIVTNRPTWDGGEAAAGTERIDDLCAAIESEHVAAVDVELGAVAEREDTPGATPGVPAGDSVVAREAREHTDTSDMAADPADAVDGQRVIDHARAHDTAVIVSTHDFEATPDRPEMYQLLSTASEYGDVGKLAVTASDNADVLDLFGATWGATQAGHRVATMAMGEAGRHSRAVAPLYGSRIGYAPVDPANATAPGQYDLATLADLVASLHSE